VRRVLAALAAGLALAAAAAQPQAARAGTEAASAPRIEAYFSPADDVAGVIARHIGAARESVQVQAYLFTHRGLAAALARAARRGVAVDVIADAKQYAGGGWPVARSLDRAGVRLWLHDGYAAFHHKVVLVDARSKAPVVITGSFNFTLAAQERNAENVVVVTGERALAARFADDFARNLAQASRLQ